MKNILFTHLDSTCVEHIQSLALGKFDGMHLAHQAILALLGENGAIMCIEDSDSKSLLTPDKSIYTHYPIMCVPFKKIKQLDGIVFIQMLLECFSSLKRLVVGYDFHFGKNRAYNATHLSRICQNDIIIVPEYCVNGLSVHSSVIRHHIMNGHIEAANEMLGRYYVLRGDIISGQNLGSTRLYPTINLYVKGFVLPKNGVYAGFSKINDNIYPSVCFIGERLSTDGVFSIETHILDNDLHINVATAEVFLAHRIRDNIAFADLDALKKQISNDIEYARIALKHKSFSLL